ncbi:MAG: RluA family pseudouridine synthase [Clostridia bacterium]|nr:RluA family pseudouridine synthase [Clostridia bacterium]
MRILEHTITPQEAGQALRILVPKLFHLSSHAFRRLKVHGNIRVNGEPRHVSYCPEAGDLLAIHLQSETVRMNETRISAPDTLNEQNCGQRLIVYMDDDLLIADKPAPMATLPGRFTGGDTLRKRLEDVLGLNTDAPYHPVNRLDKGTSGLLCIARHDHAQHLLTQSLHSGAFVREYLAVTDGIPDKQTGIIRAPIARAGSGARRIIREDGKPAVTRYTVLYAEQETGRALVRLKLETGRTHQIRVHLASIGCPVAGDYLYGREHPGLKDRFALHSAYLRCTQPITGQKIECTSPLPESLRILFACPEYIPDIQMQFPETAD